MSLSQSSSSVPVDPVTRDRIPSLPWLTTAQVAQHLQISTRQVRRLVESGRLRASRICGRGPLRFLAADVERALEPVQGATERADELDDFITQHQAG